MRSIILQTKSNPLTLTSFLEFVELRTKVASLFPLMIGVLWSIYAYQSFSLVNTLLFASATLIFDMCTTAINNTVDYHKALDDEYKHTENVIGKFRLEMKQMIMIVLALLGLAICLSLILVWRTDLLLLPMGMLCFFIGITYTFGPMPLSRLPLGEVFSGLTMGFGIFFLAIYIQNPTALMSLEWGITVVSLHLAWREVVTIAFMSIPLVCLIANIMLANNLSDFEQDIRNHRHTLVFYIGQKRALFLYKILALLPWFIWLLAVLFGLLPRLALSGFLLFPLTYRQLQLFQEKQIKSETFVSSIKTFIMFSMMYLAILCLLVIFS